MPWEEEQRVTADIAQEQDDTVMTDLFAGGTTAGSTTGGGGQATTGGDPTTGGSGVEVTNPLNKYAGDYYFKVVTVAKSDGGANLGTVTSETTTYGQMRIALDGSGRLLAEERLCYLSTNQSSSAGATVHTVVAPAAVKNFKPIYRTFTVSDSGWSTDAVRRRQGWRSDLVPDTMPTNPNDVAKFTDPDGDNVVGYRTTVEGKATVGGLVSGGRTCAFDVVSYSDTEYLGGTYGTDGLFGTAQIHAVDSELRALYATRTSGTGTCSTDDLNTAPPATIQSDRISFARIEALADYQTCAAQSAYMSALP